MTDEKMPNNADKYICDSCDFKCCKKSNYAKHLLTSKHQNTYKILTNTDKSDAENAFITNSFSCNCGKEYKHRQSLFNHKKKCNIDIIFDDEKTDENVDKDQLILMLIKQNSELIKETS